MTAAVTQGYQQVCATTRGLLVAILQLRRKLQTLQLHAKYSCTCMHAYVHRFGKICWHSSQLPVDGCSKCSNLASDSGQHCYSARLMSTPSFRTSHQSCSRTPGGLQCLLFKPTVGTCTGKLLLLALACIALLSVMSCMLWLLLWRGRPQIAWPRCLCNINTLILFF